MAATFYAGSFQCKGSGGTQVIPCTGVDPKFIYFWTQGSAVVGATAAHNLSDGVAVGTAAADQFATASVGVNGDTTGPYAGRSCSQAAVYIISHNGTVPTLVQDASVSALGTGDFTLNYATSSDTRRVMFLAVGGADVSAFLEAFDTPTTPQSVASTTFGDQVDMAGSLTASEASYDLLTSNNIANSIGFGTDGGAVSQACIGWGSQSSTYPTNENVQQIVTAFINSVHNDSALILASLTSIDATGYTLNYTTVPGTARKAAVWGIKGINAYVGVDTQKTSEGVKLNSSVGFRPGATLFASAGAASSTSIQTGMHRAMGGATSGGIAQNVAATAASEDAVNTTNISRYQSATRSLVMLTPNGATPTVDAEAVMRAFQSNGFEMDWKIADGTAREFIVVAMGDQDVADTAGDQWEWESDSEDKIELDSGGDILLIEESVDPPAAGDQIELESDTEDKLLWSTGGDVILWQEEAAGGGTTIPRFWIDGNTRGGSSPAVLNGALIT